MSRYATFPKPCCQNAQGQYPRVVARKRDTWCLWTGPTFMASKSGIENFQRPGNTDPNRMELPFPDIFFFFVFKTTRPSRLKAAEREKSESCCVSLMALLVGSYKARIRSWYGMIAALPCLQDYTYPQAEGVIALAEMEYQNISIHIHVRIFFWIYNIYIYTVYLYIWNQEIQPGNGWLVWLVRCASQRVSGSNCKGWCNGPGQLRLGCSGIESFTCWDANISLWHKRQKLLIYTCKYQFYISLYYILLQCLSEFAVTWL